MAPRRAMRVVFVTFPVTGVLYDMTKVTDYLAKINRSYVRADRQFCSQ